jgi:hypothetical protein
MTCPVECLGTTFSLRLAAKEDVGNMLERVKVHCESTDFDSFCKRYGLYGNLFSWNNAPRKVKDRFLKACAENTKNDRSVAVLFHGTSETNIPRILFQGLDPRKRIGQAHGKGEYFGKDPGTSTSYW